MKAMRRLRGRFALCWAAHLRSFDRICVVGLMAPVSTISFLESQWSLKLAQEI